MSDIVFEIKPIIWSEYEHRTPILLQDINGPCPLIALVNTLILKNDVEVRNCHFNDVPVTTLHNKVDAFKNYLSAKPNIDLNNLLSQLGDLLIAFVDAGSNQVDLDQLLESLPLLHTGLTVNPNIINGEFNEDELAIQLFSLFKLNLYHGWVLQQDSRHDDNFSSQEYQQLSDKLQELKYFDSIQDYLLEPSDLNDSINKWLNLNQTQLTDYGLRQLNSKLDVNQIIVFFRNNHFNTLLKRQDNDFYLLVTDSSFNKNSSIVWQSLISISGKDDLFFSGDFTPVLDNDTVQPDENIDDENLKAIRKLQEQDDEEYAKRIQQSYNKRNPPVKQPINSNKKPTGNKESKEKVDKHKDKPKKSKSDCIIV